MYTNEHTEEHTDEHTDEHADLRTQSRRAQAGLSPRIGRHWARPHGVRVPGGDPGTSTTSVPTQTSGSLPLTWALPGLQVASILLAQLPRVSLSAPPRASYSSLAAAAVTAYFRGRGGAAWTRGRADLPRSHWRLVHAASRCVFLGFPVLHQGAGQPGFCLFVALPSHSALSDMGLGQGQACAGVTAWPLSSSRL